MIVLLYGSYRIMVDLIYFVWGGGTHDNRTPENRVPAKSRLMIVIVELWISFISWRRPPFINVNHKIGARKGTYQAALFFKSVLSYGSHCGMMDFIYF